MGLMKNDTFNVTVDDSDGELLLERAASIRFLMEGILLPTISTFGFLGERNGINKKLFKLDLYFRKLILFDSTT